MHYYKRNLGDYAKKAGRLSMLEHGAYTLLLDSCYDRERFPTLEEAIEWTWARTEAEIAAVKFVLSRFFELRDGIYVQDRVLEEVAKYRENAETNARIATEREEKRKNRARTVNDSLQNENEPPPQQHEAPPNHKPLTNNKDIGTNVPIVASKLDDCPHDKILQLFAKQCPHLAQPKSWTKDRQANLRARWRFLLTTKRTNGEPYASSHEEALGFFERMFGYVAKNDFLSGRTPRGWECTLPWLTKQENFLKVIEGKYDTATPERDAA